MGTNSSAEVTTGRRGVWSLFPRASFLRILEPFKPILITPGASSLLHKGQYLPLPTEGTTLPASQGVVRTREKMWEGLCLNAELVVLATSGAHPPHESWRPLPFLCWLNSGTGRLHDYY